MTNPNIFLKFDNAVSTLSFLAELRYLEMQLLIIYNLLSPRIPHCIHLMLARMGRAKL